MGEPSSSPSVGGIDPGAAEARKRARVPLLVAFTGFVFQVEATVVGVALPSITRDLSLSTESAAAVLTSFLLAATVVFLPAGRLADLRGIRPVFLGAAGLLLAGTLLCGLAPGASFLLLGRVVAGVGSGALVSASYAAIPTFVPPAQRGAAYGTVSLFVGLGMLSGNPLGGLLAQLLPWRGIFLANVPPMAALLVAGWIVLPSSRPQTAERKRGDGTGSALFDAFLPGGAAAAAVIALSTGDEYGWTAPPVLAAAAAGALLLALFLARERRASVPVVSPVLRRDLGLVTGLAALFLARVVVGGTSFLFPFYLELEAGLGPAAVGAVLLSFAGLYAAAAWGAGRISDRPGARLLVPSALAVGSAACLLFALLLGGKSLAAPVGFLLALGLAVGAFFPANNRASMAAVPAACAGEASALLSLSLNLGTVTGVALFENVATSGVPDGATMLGLVGDAAAAAALLPGFRRSFWCGAALFALAAAVSVVTVPGRRRPSLARRPS